MAPATATLVALTCKAYINSGLASIKVSGLQTLVKALHDEQRNQGHGVVTGVFLGAVRELVLISAVSNHISTYDLSSPK